MKLLKNISYTIFSNFLSILVSTLVVLVIPKFISVQEYGYWQVFIFYANYVGILHLGWADGLFLRRGGQRVEDVDVASLKAESYLFILFNLFVGLVVCFLSPQFSHNYEFIVLALGIAILVVNTRTWVTMILQSVGNFKGYAINLTAQSLVYLLLIGILLVFRIYDYRFMIVTFIISQLTTSISGFYQIKRQFSITDVKTDYSSAILELKNNVSAGFKLMIANSTALLLVGIIRFGIQQKWSVSTFGKVSLVLSIANLITVFINAVSLVLFPTLRRSSQKTAEVYEGVRSVLLPFLYIGMLIYFPIKILIPLWLPQYADTLIYAVILIPMMVYQGKFEILSNTFMKNLRMESTLMRINIATLAVSTFLTILTVYIAHGLDMAILSIVLVLGFRSILSEVIISKKLGIHYRREVLFENGLIFGFVWLSWEASLWIVVPVYIVVIGTYFVIKRDSIVNGFKTVRELSKY